MALGLPLAEIDSAGEFPNDENIDAAPNVGPKRADVLERVQQLCWSKIGEQPEFRTNTKQAVFGANIGIVPPVSADRAQQDRIGLGAGLERIRRQRITMAVDRNAAEVLLGELQVETELHRQLLEAGNSLSG